MQIHPPNPDFEQSAPFFGFRWQDVSGPQGRRWRALVNVLADDLPARCVRPLVEERTLFRMFAALSGSEDSFRAFAEAHGALGVWEGCAALAPADPGMPPITRGEPLNVWRREQRAMQDTVTVSDAVIAGDLVALRQWIQIDGLGAYLKLPGRRSRRKQVIAYRLGETVNAWVRVRGSGQDLRLGLAQHWLERQINERISRPGSMATTALLSLGKDGKTFELQTMPQSLLGAMWYQCAWALTGNRQYRQCGHCGGFIEVATGARRRNTKWCSDSCRVNACLRRKEERLVRELPASNRGGAREFKAPRKE